MKKLFIFIFVFFTFFDTVYAEEATFSKCVDGDTAYLYIDNKEEKVRFLAVDTPETKHPTIGEEPYGKEASNYTCNALKDAKSIEIEYDSNSNKKDKYDRLLVWVFVDGDLLQKKLVENGLAEVAYLYDDYKYTDELQAVEKQAKENKVGMWSNEENNDNEYLIIALIVIVLLCIFSSKYRRKTKNKLKRKASKKLENEFNKQIDKLLK